MSPIQVLLIVCAFSAAFLAVHALGCWWALIKVRHPDAFAGAPSEDPLLRQWEAVVSVAARELPGRLGAMGPGTLRDQVRLELGRAGEPSDIADTALFLLRDAPYITGQIIAVDGGRSIGW